MHKRILALFITLSVLLTMTCCKKKKSIAASEATNSEKALAETIEETIEETILGVFGSDSGIERPLLRPEDHNEKGDVTESTKQPTETVQEHGNNFSSDTESAKTTEPTQSDPTSTKPLEDKQEISTGAKLSEYERYNAMSGEEQMAFIESFDSLEAFVTWYNTAKAEYEAAHPNIEIGDGIIDAGDLVG